MFHLRYLLGSLLSVLPVSVHYLELSTHNKLKSLSPLYMLKLIFLKILQQKYKYSKSPLIQIPIIQKPW